MVFRTILAALAMLLIVPSAAMAKPARVVVVEDLERPPPKGLAELAKLNAQLREEFTPTLLKIEAKTKELNAAKTPEDKARLEPIVRMLLMQADQSYRQRKQYLYAPVLERLRKDLIAFGSTDADPVAVEWRDMLATQYAADATINISDAFAAWRNARP
jgi:hypothetical protein